MEPPGDVVDSYVVGLHALPGPGPGRSTQFETFV